MSVTRSSYRVVEVDHERATVFLVDLDEPGCRSVTNDAENVYEDVQATYPGYRVVYRDTMGRWDEIVMIGYAVSFKPYDVRVMW